MKKLLVLVIAFLLFSSTAWAVPILWSGNNNHYDFIRTNITWHNAKTEAESLRIGVDILDSDYVWQKRGFFGCLKIVVTHYVIK